METICVDDFEAVSITCNKPNNHQVPSASSTSATLALNSKLAPQFFDESASSEPPTNSFYCHRDSTVHFRLKKAKDCEIPTTSRSSMSLLQEDFETSSQHAYAEVVLDDEENTTSGVLETYEISSSDLIPPATTNDDVSSETVANAEDSSSSDAIQIIKVSDSSTASSVSNNGFFNSSEVYVINDDDDDEEEDDDDDEDEEDVDDDDVDEEDVEEEADDDIEDDDEDLEQVIAELADSDSNDISNLERADVDEDDEEEEDDMNSTSQSAIRTAEINGASEHMSNGINNGVIMSTNGDMIFLETPVIEEQQHHLSHNGQINANAEVSDFMTDKNVKPKRLSDEFSKDSSEPTMDTPISSSVGAHGDKLLQQHRTSEVIYNLSDGQLCPENERMSSRLKNMNLNHSNLRKTQDIPSSSTQTISTAKPSDVKSMDLLERRDFEHEQRLTGGIILKSSSLINNDTINLGLLKSQAQEATKDSKATQQSDGELASSSGGLNRGFFSDSKCTYKDLSATPTSSRKLIVRLTKSTAKMNLCNSLSHSPPHLKYQLQAVLKTLQHNTAEQTSTTNATSCDSNPSSTCAATTSCSGNAPASSSSASVIVDASTAGPEMFGNSNSNDSLISRPSSTSVAMSSKQTNGQKQNSRNAQDQTSGSMPEASFSLSSSSKSSSTSSVVVRVFENGCSRTSAIQPLLNNSSHNNNTDANAEPDDVDDAQPSTSSARCQYAPPPRVQRQVNASAQTTEKYLAARSSSAGNGGQPSAASDLNCSSRNGTRRSEISQNLMNDIRMLNEQFDNFPFSHQDSSWGDCEESNSDIEEVCTCHHSSISDGSCHGGSDSDVNDVDELDTSHTNLAKDGGGELSQSILQNLSISEEVSASPECSVTRKRKYNDSRLMDHDYNSTSLTGSGAVSATVESNGSKRIAYDFTSTPRSSQTNGAAALMHVSTPTATALLSLSVGSSPVGRRTPRTLIPTRDNPPPELQQWLLQFQRWSHVERLVAVDSLIEHCEPTQVRHMMKVIEPQFQRDFISLLPRELALQVLSYLDPKDLLRAAQTCRSWRFLCDDNLLWKEKCRTGQILTEPRTDRPKRGRAGNMPPIASPWKAAYMRQHIIEMNWRSRPIRQPKVLKGHDEHVITCLQFSGNRIVSGSDDNTLKVWSAVTGRCLRTLVGHTGGVWSSQMAGNIIISGSTDRTLKVWDMETGQCVHTLLGHTSTVRCMHLHGNKVVSGSRDATLRVWDIDQGTCLRVLVGHLAAVRCVQYDGKLIVSGAYDYMVKIWHPERSECLHTLQGHTNRVYSLQFDGVHVVSGSLDTSIRVWDVETGNCKHTLMGHQSLTSGMELRENILVSGNADSTVKVWDITTGQCLQTLSGPNKHQSAVTCLQFNSRFVVTSSDDGTVKLWDVKTGEFIRNLVSLESGGSGGVVWRIRANDTKLICAVGSRNGTEETKLMVLDFDVEGACVKCS